MNADACRHFYDYHFAENRKLWVWYMPSISDEELMQEVDYSIGSLWKQLVHLMSVDHIWFASLPGEEDAGYFDPTA